MHKSASKEELLVGTCQGHVPVASPRRIEPKRIKYSEDSLT